MKYFASICVMLLIGFSSISHAQMQVTPIKETLPIEIKLLYMKLLKQQPDYATIVSTNMKSETTAESLQQQQFLQTVYERDPLKTPVFTKQKLTITGADAGTQIITFKNPSSRDPILFDFGNGETYGVFIRNADILKSLAPPYEYLSIEQAYAFSVSLSPELPVEYVLMPLTADPQDFTLADGKKIHVILADVIDFKAFLPDRSRLILHKKFIDLPQAAGDGSSSDHMPSLSEAGITIPQ